MLYCTINSYFDQMCTMHACILLYVIFSSLAVIKNADLMFKQSVWTSLIAASIASKHLKEYVLLATILNDKS